jgi:prolipoprotein diacylglyceryltransferase
MKLNMGQILSIPFIIIGIYFMGKNLIKKETKQKTSH